MADNLRYPLGEFSPKGTPLTPSERSELIDRIEAHPGRIRRTVEGLSDEQLDTPYREGGWTVRQVVHHLVDSHTNAYVRFKLGVTEEVPTIRPYDQDAWARCGDAVAGPLDLSLPLLEGLHRRWVAFLRTLSVEAFHRTMFHPEMDANLTLDTLLELYGWHCRHHEAHISGLRERAGW
jgi:hypothetical protein